MTDTILPDMPVLRTTPLDPPVGYQQLREEQPVTRVHFPNGLTGRPPPAWAAACGPPMAAAPRRVRSCGTARSAVSHRADRWLLRMRRMRGAGIGRL